MVQDVVALLDHLVEQDLRSRLEGGEFIRPMSGPGVSYGWLLGYCKQRGLRSRNCHHPKEHRAKALAAVIDEGLPIRQAAQSVGMSRSSVHRAVMRERTDIVDSVDRVGFRSVPTYRCPVHGMITVSPCPACVATQGRS